MARRFAGFVVVLAIIWFFGLAFGLSFSGGFDIEERTLYAFGGGGFVLVMAGVFAGIVTDALEQTGGRE